MKEGVEMNGGINLHDVVRGVITAIHPDEEVTLYRSEGLVNSRGVVKTRYAAPEVVKAQIQSDGVDALKQVDKVSQTALTVKAYFYAPEGSIPAGVVRPYCRTGDMVQRTDGTWWLVTAEQEEFARVEWVRVQLTYQTTPPDFSISEWDDPDDPDDSDPDDGGEPE